MNSLRKLFRLSPERRTLLLQAFLLIGFTRLGLWLLPFRTIRGIQARLATLPSTDATAEPDVVEDIVWAVTTASRRIPGATCLTQALVAEVLLRRRGCPAKLQIGVHKGRQVEAHAWVEAAGRTVIGGADSALRFSVLRSASTHGTAAAGERGGNNDEDH